MNENPCDLFLFSKVHIRKSICLSIHTVTVCVGAANHSSVSRVAPGNQTDRLGGCLSLRP